MKILYYKAFDFFYLLKSFFKPINTSMYVNFRLLRYEFFKKRFVIYIDISKVDYIILGHS